MDADSDGTNEEIGSYETTLTELVIATAIVGDNGMREFKLDAPAGAKEPERGILMLGCNEKKTAKKQIKFQLEVEGLPACNSMMECNFSTTYFLEIHRANQLGGPTFKFFESEYFVDEFDYSFTPMEFND